MTAIAACFGLRPVANAFGRRVVDDVDARFRQPAGDAQALDEVVQPLVLLRDRPGGRGSPRSAILSAFQYETNATAPDDHEGDDRRDQCRAVAEDSPTTAPTTATTTATEARRSGRRCGACCERISSNMVRLRDGRRRGHGSAQNSTSGASRAAFVGLEVLALLEVERSWRRYTVGNCWSLLLYVQHGVVVELPGVGHAALGGGQLLLQGQEVLVGLQVGVGLAAARTPGAARR